MPTVPIQNTFDADVKMLLDIPSPMKNVISDKVALNLVDIAVGNTLQILC